MTSSLHHSAVRCAWATRLAAVSILGLVLSLVSRTPTTAAPAPGPTVLEFDVKSKYSHIQVTRQGNVRMMIFVRDNGQEVVETRINLNKPYELLSTYCRCMFTSYLVQPKQERVLIVGLGGGAMVHFLQHYDPTVQIEAVEIDPAVVDIADRFFRARTGRNVQIITDDAFHYLSETKNQYDIIYMDAFLKPSADTDKTGTPLRLKTIEFYKSLQKKLSPGGLVAFNLTTNSGIQEDVNTIHAAFEQVLVFHTPEGNCVVRGLTSKTKLDAAALRERARETDRRFHATFSFVEPVDSLSK